MIDKQAYVECLVNLIALKVYEGYYKMSSGNAHSTTLSESLWKLSFAYERLCIAQPFLEEEAKARIGQEVFDWLFRLRQWHKDHKEKAGDLPEWLNTPEFSVYLNLLELYLTIALEIEIRPSIVTQMEEIEFAATLVRWRPHLPDIVLPRGKQIIDEANLESSIVIVGDIRRSQDLMTYASSSSDFAERMVEFLSEMRLLVDYNYGIFDKFTGDGFIAYFTPATCGKAPYTFQEYFIKFVREAHSFAKDHFCAWSQTIRKHPQAEIGLAFGADYGHIQFHDEADQFVAVGDAIVWATRLADQAQAGELWTNNLLKQEVRRTHPQIQFTECNGTTKSGESFRAFNLNWDSVP